MDKNMTLHTKMNKILGINMKTGTSKNMSEKIGVCVCARVKAFYPTMT